MTLREATRCCRRASGERASSASPLRAAATDLQVRHGQVTTQAFLVLSILQGSFERFIQSETGAAQLSREKDKLIFLSFTVKKLQSSSACPEEDNCPRHGMMVTARRRLSRVWAAGTAEAMQIPTLTQAASFRREISMLQSSPAPSAWGLQRENTTGSLMMDGQNLFTYQMISNRSLILSCQNGTLEMQGRDGALETTFHHFCKFSIPTATTCCTTTTGKTIRKLKKPSTRRTNYLR